MRVAIRRLRVALRMAEKLRSDKELAFLRDMAGNIGRMLGSMREWDVFIAGVVLPAMTSMEGNAGKVLLKACEDKRAGLCARLDPVMLQRFLLRSGIWMSGEYWKKAGRAGPSLVGFSQRIMRRLHSSSKHFGDELHALRIRLKKLRYSGEFFSALYHRKKAASYLSALSRAQDELGLINDIAVSHKLLEEMEKDMPRQRKAIAVLRKKLDGDMPVSKMRLEKALKNLDLQQPFWK
jgi:CHAD domain-containing protein